MYKKQIFFVLKNKKKFLLSSIEKKSCNVRVEKILKIFYFVTKDFQDIKLDIGISDFIDFSSPIWIRSWYGPTLDWVGKWEFKKKFTEFFF